MSSEQPFLVKGFVSRHGLESNVSKRKMGKNGCVNTKQSRVSPPADNRAALAIIGHFRIAPPCPRLGSIDMQEQQLEEHLCAQTACLSSREGKHAERHQ